MRKRASCLIEVNKELPVIGPAGSLLSWPSYSVCSTGLQKILKAIKKLRVPVSCFTGCCIRALLIIK